MSKNKILFKLSGSIACYKACSLISMLVKQGYEVKTVASEAALQFIGDATLEGLTGHQTLSQISAPGTRMSHIDLARWADLSILCPATANSVGQLANGLGDSLVSALFLAHDFSHPYLLAPAMNHAMYDHPATRANLKRLESWGVQVLNTASGRQACGEIGAGNLLDPEAVFAQIETALSASVATSGKKLRVLVSSGGTEEPIDGVRSIVNFSTGRTGAAFADHFHRRGHDVCLLRAESAVAASEAVETQLFKTFSDLDDQLKILLRNRSFDAVIHLAAVGDYRVDSVEVDGETRSDQANGKLDSGGELAIRLSVNHKIIERIRDYSQNAELRLVAFKLTHGSGQEEANRMISRLFERTGADLVVHNDLNEIDHNGHKATIYRQGSRLAETSTKEELAAMVEAMLVEPGKPIETVNYAPVS